MPCPSSFMRKKCCPLSLPRVIVIFRAEASMLFSTNSATAFNGFCCERAMIVMAFQSSPIRNRPEFFMMRSYRSLFQHFREKLFSLTAAAMSRRGAKKNLAENPIAASGLRKHDGWAQLGGAEVGKREVNYDDLPGC